MSGCERRVVAGGSWPLRLVGLAGAEQGGDDVAAAPGQAGQGGVVPFAVGSLAVVGRLGGRVAQGRGGGEEHGVREPVVAAAAARFAVEGLAGLAADRGQAGVGGKLAAVGEGGAVADLGEDPGAGPRPDPCYRGEGTTERVRQERVLDLGGEGVAAGGDAAEL